MNKSDKLREVIRKVCDSAGGDRNAALRRIDMRASADKSIADAITDAAHRAFIEEIAGQVMVDRPDLAYDLPALGDEVLFRLRNRKGRR
jgi:hypothetical protein